MLCIEWNIKEAREVIDTKEKVVEEEEVEAEEAYLGNIRLNLKARHANPPQRYLLI